MIKNANRQRGVTLFELLIVFAIALNINTLYLL